MKEKQLICQRPEGLYCEAGNFYIDPSQPVEKAIITHGHGDHAYPGSTCYLTASSGLAILRKRLGRQSRIETLHYGQPIELQGVRVSLHPAGHILGSSQVRVEYQGEVWVVSGDYKLQKDPTCAPFEVVPCHTFITEATFGKPIYAWPDAMQVMQEIKTWWKQNQSQGKGSVLYAYALGKAQRILASLNDGEEIGPIFSHYTVDELNRAYEKTGVNLPKTRPIDHRIQGGIKSGMSKTELARSLIILPPWVQKYMTPDAFGPAVTAFASGWMLLPDSKQSRGVDTGFVLSDHGDFMELCQAVSSSKAERVYTMHGSATEFAAYLQTQGVQAQTLHL